MKDRVASGIVLPGDCTAASTLSAVDGPTVPPAPSTALA
jgi:hypothetical protein